MSAGQCYATEATSHSPPHTEVAMDSMYPSLGLGGSSNGDSLHLSIFICESRITHARSASSSDNNDAPLPRLAIAAALDDLGVVETDRLGECLNPLPAPAAIPPVLQPPNVAGPSSGDPPRSGVALISGEADGDVCLDPGGEGEGAMSTSWNGFGSSSIGGVAGVGSNTIAGIPSASALRVRRLSSRRARNRLRQYIVRSSPRTRSRLTRSVTRSVFSRRTSRSSSLVSAQLLFFPVCTHMSAFSSSISLFCASIISIAVKLNPRPGSSDSLASWNSLANCCLRCRTWR